MANAAGLDAALRRTTAEPNTNNPISCHRRNSCPRLTRSKCGCRSPTPT